MNIIFINWLSILFSHSITNIHGHAYANCEIKKKITAIMKITVSDLLACLPLCLHGAVIFQLVMGNIQNVCFDNHVPLSIITKPWSGAGNTDKKSENDKSKGNL